MERCSFDISLYSFCRSGTLGKWKFYIYDVNPPNCAMFVRLGATGWFMVPGWSTTGGTWLRLFELFPGLVDNIDRLKT
jgi:hypothetical protein